MIEQQRCGQYGNVPDHAGQESSSVPAPVDPDIRDSPHDIEGFCMKTRRGCFGALAAGPLMSSHPPALIVHGFGCCKDDFIPVLKRIAAAGYRAYAYTRRGYPDDHLIPGLDTDDGDVRLEAHARDVRAVMDALDCDRVHLMGHSFGAHIVCAAALDDPDGIATLTLSGAGPEAVHNRHAEELDLLIWAMYEWPPSEVYKAVKAHMTRPRPGRHAAVMDAAQESFLRRLIFDSQPVLLADAHALRTEKDRVDELAELGLRVCMISGVDENIWPRDIQRHMAERLHAWPVKVEDAGHSSHGDNPGATARELVKFWATADAADQSTPALTVAAPAPSGQHRPGHDAALPCSKEQSSAA